MCVDAIGEVPSTITGYGNTVSTQLQSGFPLSQHDCQAHHSMSHKASGQ